MAGRQHPTPADWRLLGLAPGATPEDILRAYDHRRALYDEESLASYSLLLDGERRRQLDRLLEARDRLLAAATAPRARPEEAPPSPADATTGAEIGPAPDREQHPGAWLGHLRSARGLTVDQLSKETKIRPTVIDQLEGERYDRLPAPVFVRGFVIQVARALAVPDPESLAALYLRQLEKGGGR
jgi:curved DNA-binding protein CbpA